MGGAAPARPVFVVAVWSLLQHWLSTESRGLLRGESKCQHRQGVVATTTVALRGHILEAKRLDKDALWLQLLVEVFQPLLHPALIGVAGGPRDAEAQVAERDAERDTCEQPAKVQAVRLV